MSTRDEWQLRMAQFLRETAQQIERGEACVMNIDVHNEIREFDVGGVYGSGWAKLKATGRQTVDVKIEKFATRANEVDKLNVATASMLADMPSCTPQLRDLLLSTVKGKR